MEIRSFLAFELPTQISEIVSHVCQEMRKTSLDVRWVREDHIHLTIIFMGNVLADQIENIGNSVEKLCQNYGPFTITLRGTGLFPGKRNPRVLWIGLAGDLERMADFRDALQQQLKVFGIRQETRPLRPHLTIARFRKGAKPSVHLEGLLSNYQNLTSPVCKLEELILFKSSLKPTGAVYSKLGQWPLSGNQ
jgi:2'-5' RNA ligase